MDSHSVVRQPFQRPFYSGGPVRGMDLMSLMSLREREHGTELARELYKNGCKIAYVGRDFTMLTHLLGDSNMEDIRDKDSYAEQKSGRNCTSAFARWKKRNSTRCPERPSKKRRM